MSSRPLAADASTEGIDRQVPADGHQTSIGEPVPRARRRALRRARGMAAVVVAVVLAAVAAAGVVRAVRSASTGPAVPPGGGVAVWEPVERGVLEVTASFTATGTAPEVVPLESPLAGRVLGVDVVAGDQIGNGKRIAVVSGRPLVAVEADVFVPYRDLSVGDTGPDVAELQRFLTELGYYDRPIDDRFGRGLRGAVERFYEAHGLEDQRSLSADTLVVVAPSAVVRSVSVDRGDDLDVGGEVLQFNIGVDVARGSIADVSSVDFPPGTEVTLHSSDGPLAGHVAEIGDVVESSQGTPARRVEVAADDGSIVVGRRYRVSTVVEASGGSSLIVPALAVQARSDGSHFVQARGPEGSERVVEIVVILSDGSRTAVEADGLPVGWEARLPSPSGSTP